MRFTLASLALLVALSHALEAPAQARDLDARNPAAELDSREPKGGSKGGGGGGDEEDEEDAASGVLVNGALVLGAAGAVVAFGL